MLTLVSVQYKQERVNNSWRDKYVHATSQCKQRRTTYFAAVLDLNGSAGPASGVALHTGIDTQEQYEHQEETQ